MASKHAPLLSSHWSQCSNLKPIHSFNEPPLCLCTVLGKMLRLSLHPQEAWKQGSLCWFSQPLSWIFLHCCNYWRKQWSWDTRASYIECLQLRSVSSILCLKPEAQLTPFCPQNSNLPSHDVVFSMWPSRTGWTSFAFMDHLSMWLFPTS